MRFSILALTAAPLLAMAKSALDFDFDDVPEPCVNICRPIATLVKQCDVDSDHKERLLTNQCICTNKSFDVAKISALCADCMHQNVKTKRDHDQHADADDVKDIDHIMSTCTFASTHYDPTVTSMVATITVDAVAPNNQNQLTTTIEGPSSHNAGPMVTAAANMVYIGGAAAAALLL